MAARASIRDVAERAAVSVGTVSNFLNDNKPIAPATAERIRAAIDELGFIPNAAVRVMQGARSHALAFLVPDLSNPFLAEVSRGIEDVALEHGHIVIACNTDGDADREQRFAQVLAEMRVAGAITMAMTAEGEPLQLVKDSGARVVLVGSRSDEYISVDIDNPLAGYLAMEHLLQRGHRRCAFFGGPGAEPQILERLDGIHRASAETGREGTGRGELHAPSLVDAAAAALRAVDCRVTTNCCGRGSHAPFGRRFLPPTPGTAVTCRIHSATWLSSRSSTVRSSTPRVALPIPTGVTGGTGASVTPLMNMSLTWSSKAPHEKHQPSPTP